MDLSVIICTWNNSRRLAVTLEAISRCVIPADVQWELVLVNNNSMDETPAVAAEFADRLPLVYMEEPRQGLSRARNAGLKAASGRLVVFTDDDVRPCGEWLQVYWDAYQERTCGFYFGGPLTSEREAETLDAELLRLAPAPVVGLDWGPESRILDEDQHFRGANWACPSDALRRAGGFDVRLGLDTSLGRRRIGEERDLMDRLRRLGALPWYLPRARVDHFVPKEKCGIEYIAGNAEASGAYSVYSATTVAFLHSRPELRWWCERRGPVVAGIPLAVCVKAISLVFRWGLSMARGRPTYEEYLSLRFCIGVLKGYRQGMRDRTIVSRPGDVWLRDA